MRETEHDKWRTVAVILQSVSNFAHSWILRCLHPRTALPLSWSVQSPKRQWLTCGSQIKMNNCFQWTKQQVQAGLRSSNAFFKEKKLAELRVLIWFGNFIKCISLIRNPFTFLRYYLLFSWKMKNNALLNLEYCNENSCL